MHGALIMAEEPAIGQGQRQQQGAAALPDQIVNKMLRRFAHHAAGKINGSKQCTFQLRALTLFHRLCQSKSCLNKQSQAFSSPERCRKVTAHTWHQKPEAVPGEDHLMVMVLHLDQRPHQQLFFISSIEDLQKACGQLPLCTADPLAIGDKDHVTGILRRQADCCGIEQLS